MSVIDRIMETESAKWINDQLEHLPERAKYRASSSIRSLFWANRIYYETGLPIPACYCALHATEEAVSAFVSCAKECGYGDDAKNINIKDHAAKATVSLLAQKITNFLAEFQPASALNPKTNRLTARVTVDGDVRYYDEPLKFLHYGPSQDVIANDYYDKLICSFSDISGLKAAVKQVQESRNGIFYADKNGIPMGFDEPEASLERECQLTLGLLWVSIEIQRCKGENIPFVVQSLRTANRVIDELKRK